MKLINAYPTMNLNGESQVKEIDGNLTKQYTEKSDGFVLIHPSDQDSPASIDDKAKLDKLKAFNAELLISSESYRCISTKETKKGNLRSVYLPGTMFEL